MISTNHTPGPWTIDGERIGPPGEPVALLCDINAPESGIVVDWPRMPGEAVDDAENEANARLIASAPALLRILQGFVSSRISFFESNATSRFNLDANRALWDAAADICNLVTGEETEKS